MDKHIYCCQRCGDIFESDTDEYFCAPCRAMKAKSEKYAKSAQKVVQAAKISVTCVDCGTVFYSTACAAARCEDCRKARKQMQDSNRYHGAIHNSEPKKIPYKKPTTITEVVKAAAAMGLSYGDYVRRYGGQGE